MASVQRSKRNGKPYGNYYVVYKDLPDPVTGRRHQVWEHTDTRNKRRAELRAQEIEELLAAGRSPSVAAITFEDAWERRMATIALSGTTRPKTQNVYDTHLTYFSGRQIRTLNCKQVFALFREHLRDKGLADKTVGNVMSELRAFINWCYTNEYLTEEPKPDWWDIPKGHARNQRPLTYQQVEELAQAVGGDNLMRKTFVLFSAYVGTRLGETRAIRWEDFSDGLTEVWVRRAWQGKTTKDWTKTGDTRHTPLMPRVRQALEELREQQGNPAEGWVFADEDGKAMDGDNFRQRHYNKGKAAVGLDTYTVHDLRHTCCSLMHKAGATPREIMDWLGWKNLTTLLRYLHNFDEEHDIAERMQQRWGEATGAHTQRTADDAGDEWSCCL